MEILGSTFDDSVFEESRNRVSAALPAYEPKLCEPLVGITLNTYHKLPIPWYGNSTCIYSLFTYLLSLQRKAYGITTVVMAADANTIILLRYSIYVRIPWYVLVSDI